MSAAELKGKVPKLPKLPFYSFFLIALRKDSLGFANLLNSSSPRSARQSCSHSARISLGSYPSTFTLSYAHLFALKRRFVLRGTLSRGVGCTLDGRVCCSCSMLV